MVRHVLAAALAASLFSVSLGAAAQQVKIESQGQAEQNAQRQTIVAKTMSEAVGAPATGTGQVVFFRASNSPGAAIDVVADGTTEGGVGPGMYLAVAATPGSHSYGPGMLGVTVKAGETKYVQVIRGRDGAPKLLASTATTFQNAARRSH
jgi:hypothetical protein